MISSLMKQDDFMPHEEVPGFNVSRLLYATPYFVENYIDNIRLSKARQYICALMLKHNSVAHMLDEPLADVLAWADSIRVIVISPANTNQYWSTLQDIAQISSDPFITLGEIQLNSLRSAYSPRGLANIGEYIQCLQKRYPHCDKLVIVETACRSVSCADVYDLIKLGHIDAAVDALINVHNHVQTFKRQPKASHTDLFGRHSYGQL